MKLKQSNLNVRVDVAKQEVVIQDLKAENAKLKQSSLIVEADVAATRNVFNQCVANGKKSWALKRVNYIFPRLAKIQLHYQAVTYIEKIPANLLPRSTKAIVISILCHFWNTGPSDTNMFLAVYQRGNKGSGTTNVANKHYNVHGNWFNTEVMVPWNGGLGREAVFKLTNTYNPEKNLNWYQVKLVGVITA